MKFTINYTIDDYIKAQKLYSKNSRSGWILRYVVPIIGLALIIVIGANWISGERQSAYGSFSTPLFILGIFYLFLPFIITPLTTRWFYKRSKFLQVPNEMEINETEIKTINSLSSGAIKWELFIKYAYNNDMLILMSTPRTMLMIPHRFVSSEEDWNKLLELAKEKIKKI